MKPLFIIIDGPMGSGKSTVAEMLHPKMKKMAYVGVDRIKWFVSDFRRTKKDNAIARKVLIAMCDAYLKNGVGILMAHGFREYATMKPFLQLAKRRHARLFQYRLEAPRHVLLDRIAKRPKAKLAIAKSRILRNLRAHAKFQYRGATLIDTSSMTPHQVADFILKDLRK